MDVIIKPVNASLLVQRHAGSSTSSGSALGTTEPTLQLRHEAEQVAVRLRKALEDVVFRLVGASPRPGDLAARAGLDKSMASRLIQVLRTQDPLTALQRSPAPHGLRIFLRAAESAGAAKAAIGRAEEAVTEFETIISRFPSGRSGLDGALSGWLPEARNQGERVARQTVFKGMSFLLGHQVDVSIWAILMQPSAEGATLDVAHVRGKFGLRRLRQGEPLEVFSIRNFPLTPGESPRPQVEPLVGAAHGIKSFLLNEYCHPPEPTLDLTEVEGEQHFLFPSTHPPVNVPVTIVLAELVRRGIQRFATPDRLEEWQTIFPRFPSKITISDIFLRDDVYPGVEPIVTKSLVGVHGKKNPTKRGSTTLDEVDIAVETSWLPSASDIGTGEVPHYSEMMSSVFAQLGWDANRFRVHRLKMNYPPPGIAITRWFPLPVQPRLPD